MQRQSIVLLTLLIATIGAAPVGQSFAAEDSATRVPNRPRTPGVLELELRSRDDQSGAPRKEIAHWQAAETAIIICDMWDDHYCESAAQRVGVMAPTMNRVLSAARSHGVMIIHAPSGCMDVYAAAPHRKRMQQAAHAEPPVPIGNWCYLDPEVESALPIEDEVSPCDDPVVGPQVRKYSRQHAAIDIIGYDGVSDSGAEIYNFCRQEGIKNIVLMGVHTNMCVLGRPFGIRQQVRLGMNVALCRDLTDAMYDPRQPPYVSHDRGTQLVVEHIEKYWCPSIESADLTHVFPGSADPVEVDPDVPGEVPSALELKEVIAVKRPGAAAAPAEAAERPAAKTITVRGKVLDDATGEAIERLITQAGKFDPTDPAKITWGYSEGRSSARDGSFSTTIRWAEGWTARILADGYVPQPVITSAPPADKDEMEVVIRLKRGPIVRGVVLDHLGHPVQDAAVFAVGPTGINLSAGEARLSIRSSDDHAQPVRTDADGRFELPTGDAKSLAVSHSTLDAWPAEIPADGEVTVRLPEPARVDIELAIDGADKESTIFYQLLTEGRKEFTGVRLEREVTIANPGKFSLVSLPPGRYQLCRNVMNNLGEVGMGAMLEREFFELKAGETKLIRYVRDKGARIRGTATWPADTKLMGIIISVRSLFDQKSPFDRHEWPVAYASHTAAQDGAFETERILPGKYLLVAEGYAPLTPEQRFRSGFIRPGYRAQLTIDVPTNGDLKVDNLILRPSQATE